MWGREVPSPSTCFNQVYLESVWREKSNSPNDLDSLVDRLREKQDADFVIMKSTVL